ncbi:MAG: ribonuclease Z [Acidimicrobiales bacterium]
MSEASQETLSEGELAVTLLGTGSPMPDPNRAGPATLISAGEGPEAEHYLVDAGRGVLMRLAAAGLGAPNLTAVLITHLHSDHITDLNDVITTRWVMTFEKTPLTIVGPVGTQSVVNHLLASLEPDIGYRIAHHEDLDHRPPVTVIEVSEGAVELPDGQGGNVAISCAETDHKPVEPSVGYRFEFGGAAVVTAGDTVPCVGLDALCSGADALVHTVIRKDIIANVPFQRMQDTLDYHSSPGEAAQTAAKAEVATLILTHYVPAMPMSGTEDDWRNLAAEHFGGAIEIGDDLHRVVVQPRS